MEEYKHALSIYVNDKDGVKICYEENVDKLSRKMFKSIGAHLVAYSCSDQYDTNETLNVDGGRATITFRFNKDQEFVDAIIREKEVDNPVS